MAETIELEVEARDRVGKGAARAIRRQGKVPAVIYGDNKDPEPITIEHKPLWKHVQTGTFLSTVFTLKVGSKKTRVIPRDIQFDPVRDFPIHVDFLRLGKGAEINVEVPVHFLNESTCPGLKRGGALNVVRHEIELTCSADSIPETIEIDLAGLDIGDSIHISQVELPKGVSPVITDRDFTIVTIAGAGPSVEEEEAAEAEEAEAETETTEE